MKRPDRRVAALLFVYPRAYRARRGDEIIATLDAVNASSGRLTARDVISVLRHGISLRAQQLRPAYLVVALAMLGAALGAGVSLEGSNAGYVASGHLVLTRHEPTAAQRSNLQLGVGSTLIQLLSQDQSRRQVLTPLGRPWPSCVVDEPGSVVALTCRADTSHKASAAVVGFTALLARRIVERQVSADTSQLRDLTKARRVNGVALRQLTLWIAHLSRANDRYLLVQATIVDLRHSIEQATAAERRIAVQLTGVTSGFAAVGPSTRSLASVSPTSVLAGGAAGLLLGGLLVASRTRRRGGRALATS